MTHRTKETPLDEALWAAKRSGNWLAEQLNVSISQVSRWRRGASIPNDANKRRIAKALRVSVKSLWPSEDDGA